MISRSLRTAAVAGALAASLVGAATAAAATTVSLDDEAKLTGDGSVIARVTVTCDPGKEVLEAEVRISQDERTSGTGGISKIRCDGRPHTLKVRVTPIDGAFHEGAASASAFVLIFDPGTNTTEQGQDSTTITIR